MSSKRPGTVDYSKFDNIDSDSDSESEESYKPNIDNINKSQFDDDDMPFVYGNQRGVPYKLQKVSNFITSYANTEIELELQRELVNSDLEWTLGEEYRTKELFQQKMQSIDK